MVIISNRDVGEDPSHNRMVEEVLLRPALDCDELKVLTGYVSSSMARRHLDELDSILEDTGRRVRIHVMYGMVPDKGISKIEHEGFQNLVRMYPDVFMCSYMVADRKPCHTKIYVWYREGVPVKAFIGSANYSQNAFYLIKELEAMYECDPVEAANYIEGFSGDVADCDYDDIDDVVLITSRTIDKGRQEEASATGSGPQIEMPPMLSGRLLRLSLLASDGKIGIRSHLNWGQRPGRNPDQAYIPIPRPIGLKIVETGFFPPKGTYFTVMTDDGFSMYCVTAQNSADDPVPKAVETCYDNSELGRYFRRRLGLKEGEFVTKQHLLNYGRTYVDFINLDDGTYYMDFSSKL